MKLSEDELAALEQYRAMREKKAKEARKNKMLELAADQKKRKEYKDSIINKARRQLWGIRLAQTGLMDVETDKGEHLRIYGGLKEGSTVVMITQDAKGKDIEVVAKDGSYTIPDLNKIIVVTEGKISNIQDPSQPAVHPLNSKAVKLAAKKPTLQSIAAELKHLVNSKK